MPHNYYLFINFGGPRDLSEVEEFLICLLTDQEVIRTRLPFFLHRRLFTQVARKRAKQVIHDYALIGGKSPIYEDTEAIAQTLAHALNAHILTFHRYLPSTHASFLHKINTLPPDAQVRVFPFFPQFSSATTGSIKKWFCKYLHPSTLSRMHWVYSYCDHPAYLAACEQVIRDLLEEKKLVEERTILLFSAHGLPHAFIASGDVYQMQCEKTYESLISRFPRALSRLCYQSQFGKEEWIRPYTVDLCRTIDAWGKGYDNCVVVPLSFTSDHIETLFEIEKQYVPLIAERGFQAFRCPALNRRGDWLQAIEEIIR